MNRGIRDRLTLKERNVELCKYTNMELISELKSRGFDIQLNKDDNKNNQKIMKQNN